MKSGYAGVYLTNLFSLLSVLRFLFASEISNCHASVLVVRSSHVVKDGPSSIRRLYHKTSNGFIENFVKGLKDGYHAEAFSDGGVRWVQVFCGNLSTRG